MIKRARKDHFATDDMDVILKKIARVNNRTTVILILNILLQIAILILKWLKEG